MPSTNGVRNGKGDGGKPQKNDKALLEELREVCPPHRQGDLAALIKKSKGDEEKCRKQISEWWEEPSKPQEPDWEDVNKKHGKKAAPQSAPGGRGGRGRSGRGGRGRGGETGRSGRGGRGRGRGAPKSGPETSEIKPKADVEAPVASGVPARVNVRPAQGVWGKKEEPIPAATPAAPQAHPDVTDSTASAPTPPVTGTSHAEAVSSPPPEKPAAPTHAAPRTIPPAGGNVWAIKGSMHLIQAEKSKPKPAAPIQRNPPAKPQASPASAPVLETGAPWTTSAAASNTNLPTTSTPPPAAQVKPSTPITTDPPAPPVPPSPVGTKPIGSPMAKSAPPAPIPEPSALPEAAPVSVPVPPSPPAQPPKPRQEPNVLNMGHWETGDTDDNLDFGFGTFSDMEPAAGNGSAPAAPSSTEPPVATPPPPPAAAPSPARPPPGLPTIAGGMRPIPADAVLVSELENKLETTNLQGSSDKSSISATPTTQVTVDTSNTGVSSVPSHTGVPTSTMAQPSPYSQYGGMGMYTNPGAPFVGMPGLPKPVGGLPPHQQPTLYGGATQGSNPPSAPTSGGAPAGLTGATGTSADATPGAPGMPPGMPGMPPYANPALYYGQQPYMAQHQGQLGYNYGYGAQFGGAVQGGFGYPQPMGQTGGYGHHPNYDDHTPGQPGGGYQKSGGGYRRNNNQYQNQYNPQHGGYGGSPYGMGYHGDHFGQRGGYGGAMQDHYMQQQQQQQQQQQGVGFHDDDHNKGGRKGGRYQQFQQHGGGHLNHPPPPQEQHQQQNQHQQQPPFGLQQGSDSTPTWTNPSPGAASGAWGGGAPSWQGK